MKCFKKSGTFRKEELLRDRIELSMVEEV